MSTVQATSHANLNTSLHCIRFPIVHTTSEQMLVSTLWQAGMQQSYKTAKHSMKHPSCVKTGCITLNNFGSIKAMFLQLPVLVTLHLWQKRCKLRRQEIAGTISSLCNTSQLMWLHMLNFMTYSSIWAEIKMTTSDIFHASKFFVTLWNYRIT